MVLDTKGESFGVPTPAGRLLPSSDSRSEIPWRATCTSMPFAKVTVTTDKPGIDSERSVASPAAPLTAGLPARCCRATFGETCGRLHVARSGDRPQRGRADSQPARFFGRIKNPSYLPEQPLGDTNPAEGPAAKQSLRLDFSAPDAADTATLNAILWQNLKGVAPYPQPARISTLEVQRGF